MAERGRGSRVILLDTGSARTLFIDLVMKQEVKSMIIVCDGCGEHFHDGNDFCSYVDDENGEYIEQSALSSEWMKFGDKHYCPDCYELDDEDHYHTKDGKVWDADTEEEIKI